MVSDYFRDTTPTMRILLTLFFCLLGLLIFMVIGMVIVFAINGAGSIDYLTNPDPTQPEVLIALKILQVAQAIGLFIVPGFIVPLFLSPKPIDYLGFRKTSMNLIVLSVLLLFFAIPAINLMASINSLIPMPDWMNSMEGKAENLTKAFMQYHSPSGFVFNIIMIAILPALGEELIFRGIVQKLFTELTKKAFLGVIISAALFSAMHLQFQGFLPRFGLGVLFGYLFLWSGSLWLPIIGHFTNNLVAFVGFTLISQGELTPKAESIGSLFGTWFWGLISFGIVILFLRRIRSESTRS